MSSTAIAEAARLLRDNAEELKNAHTIGGLGEWRACEPEVKAVYDNQIRVADALDAIPGPCLAQITEPAPLPLLVRDIARELGITSVEACIALKPLGSFSTNMAVTGEMMAKLRECFPVQAAKDPSVAAMNEDGYLPCPFCGSDQVSLSTGEAGDGTPWHYVECESCAATSEDGKWNERPALSAQAAPVTVGERTDLYPGVMRCAKCEFQLVRAVLSVQSGQIHAGDSKTEPCPNGCGPLWPVTYKEYAKQAMDSADAMADRAIAAEKEVETLRAALAAKPADHIADTGKMVAAAPVVLPHPDAPSSAPILRAMSENYSAGHLWDTLDAQTCLRAANEIDRLHALLAGVSAPAGVVNLNFDTLREIVDGLHVAWCEAQGYAYSPGSEPYQEARKRAIGLHEAALSYIKALESFSALTQADALDAAPAASEQDARHIAIGKAIERACTDQPEDTEIIISLERGAGSVSMLDPDGNEHDYFQCDDGFAGVVNQAIDAAIAAQAAQQGGAEA